MIKDMFKVFENMCRHEKYELRKTIERKTELWVWPHHKRGFWG